MSTSARNHSGRSAPRRAGLARSAALAILAVLTAAPAAAQLDAVKKRLKPSSGGAQPASVARAQGAEGTGGTLVLSDEVLDQFLTGVRAGRAEREAAAKRDDGYGRYQRAQSAYQAAKAKCDAAMQTWPTRLAADEKLMKKNEALLEKMLAAAQKQDAKLQEVYADSMSALVDPSCAVKEPVQPNDWLDLKREVDGRVEQAEKEASGFSGRELGYIRDRAEAILRDAPPPDVSPSELDAIEKRTAELNGLLGIGPAPAPAPKPAAAPAPAPPPSAPAGTGMTAEQEATTNCMAKNARKHETEIARLGEAVRDAYEAGNTPAAMAIADSIRQLQMAGCPGY